MCVTIEGFFVTFHFNIYYLVDDDLVFLIGLHELAPKWKNVGLRIGVPLSKLEVIQENNRNSIDMCNESLRDTFTWWLRNKEATANNLVKYLREAGEVDAVEKINRKYGEFTVIAYVVQAGRYTSEVRVRLMTDNALTRSE